MFNNKKYQNTRLADTGFRDTASDLGAGFLSGQTDEIAKKAITKLKPGQLITKVKPSANVAAMAAGVAADPLINLGEALLSGPAKMYASRMSDAIKNINAIKRMIELVKRKVIRQSRRRVAFPAKTLAVAIATTFVKLATYPSIC